MQRITITFTIIIAACQISVAAPLEFQSHNFAIEFPSNWRLLEPPPAQTLAAAQSSDGLKTVLIVATKLPANELSTAMRDMTAGSKQSVIDKGWQITNEHETSVSDMPFHTFTTRVTASASMVTYLGLSGDESYVLQGICKKSDASSDLEVMAVINSFRLLSPSIVPTKTSHPNTPAYRVGYVFGQLLFLALIGSGIVWLIRTVKTKKNR